MSCTHHDGPHAAGEDGDLFGRWPIWLLRTRSGDGVPSGSQGQHPQDEHGTVQRSCTAWLQAGLRQELPGSDHWWLPESAAQTTHSEPWMIIPTQHGTCQWHRPLATASTFDHGITFWPRMDMAWEAQQSCSIPATPQARAGGAAPEEGPEAGGHCRWAGG